MILNLLDIFMIGICVENISFWWFKNSYASVISFKNFEGNLYKFIDLLCFQGILLPGSRLMDHLKAEFTQEALGNLQGEKDVKHVQKKLNKLWKKCVVVSCL